VSKVLSLKVALLSVLMLATACSSGSPTSGQLTKLKVAFLPFLSNAVLQIAQDDGYFKEQGLDVEFIKASSTNTVFAGLLKGDLDVLPGILNPALLNAMARGGRVKIVADKSRMSGTCDYSTGMARTEVAERIKSGGGLRGLTFRAPTDLNLVSEYFTDKVLGRYGSTRADVKFVKVDVNAIPDAMQKGQVDVVFVSEPTISQIVSSGAGQAVFSAKDFVPDFEAGIVEFGPSLLDKNPEAGRRFMVAYLKALKTYSQGATDRNVASISKFTGLDPGLVRKMCLSPVSKDGSLNIESIVTLEEWGKKEGLIDKVLSPAQFYDSSFLEYARNHPGS
jgi:NitT/TauT family transport system substrate-binding protein